MVYLQLQPHAGFGLVGTRPVFLDIRRDRYLALDGAALGAFEKARAGGPIPFAAAECLLATELFALADAPGQLAAAQAPAPEAGLEFVHRASGRSILDLPTVWRLTRRVRHELKTRPLEQILRSRRSRQLQVVAAMRADEAATLAARFRRARCVVPGSPCCLPDSLALRDWLAAHGLASTLIFGVKLEPFAAHSWVQCGKTALNEAPDKAAEFTPVFVVP